MISLFFNFSEWIPKLVHGLLIFSVIGVFASSLVSRIPFVGSYAHLVKAIATLTLIISIFGEGYVFANRRYEAAVKEYQEKVAVAEQQAKDANEKIKTVVVEKVKVIKDTTNENKTAINKYVTDECQLSNAAVLLHDSSSQNVVPPSTISSTRGTSKVKVPELLSTVTDNYGTCHETREKLKAWQDWYKNQKDIWESVK